MSTLESFTTLCVLIGSIWLTSAETIPEICKDGVAFHGQYYDKETLLDGVDGIGNFAINKKRGILFFTYSKKDHPMNSGFLNLNTKEFGEIKDIKGGFATAVDEENDVVYIGGDDGIYTYTPNNITQLPGTNGTNIYALYFWNKLYFADFPANKIYDYNSGDPKLAPAFKDNFVLFAVSTTEGLYFVNGNGLCHADNNFTTTDLYSTDNAYKFICKDSAENVFVGRRATDNEHAINVDIYKINKKEKNIEKVASIEEDVNSMVFDKDDNIIIAEAEKIIKLKVNPAKKQCV